MPGSVIRLAPSCGRRNSDKSPVVDLRPLIKVGSAAAILMEGAVSSLRSSRRVMIRAGLCDATQDRALHDRKMFDSGDKCSRADG